MKGTILITCPICKGTLEIDPASKKVLRHFLRKEKRESTDSLGDALEDIKKQDETREVAFEKLQEEKKKRLEEVEKLFEQKQKEKDSGLPPERTFDLG